MDKKSLKVVFVTNNYTPYTGGVVSSINAFSDELIARGHMVNIISLDFLGKKHNDPAHVARIPSIVRFSRGGGNLLAIPWRPDAKVLKVLKELNPDVVHAHHPFLLGQSALRAAQALSVPIVFTYHTIYERYAHYIPFFQPLVRAMVKRKVLKYCKKVDQIIAPGSYIHSYLQKEGIKTPIEVMPSPLQPHFIGGYNQHSTVGQNDKRFKLLLVSRLVKEKNIEFALDVVSQLNPNTFTLTIVGYGDQEQEIRDYAYQTLNLSPEQVTFVIKPEKAELVRLYNDADLFLFPSTSDTQGLVLAESMAAGTPVVAIEGPGQRDIVQNGVNGFIVESGSQMVEVVRQIFADKNLFATLRAGASETARNYRPDVLTDQLVDLYRQVEKK